MGTPLTSEAIARWAACRRLSVEEAMTLVQSYSPVQRRNIAEIYSDANADLLDEDSRLLADSYAIRMEMREMQERSRPMPGDDVACPYSETRDSSKWCSWHAERQNSGRSCACCRMRPL
jgi:hypothetical protein